MTSQSQNQMQKNLDDKLKKDGILPGKDDGQDKKDEPAPLSITKEQLEAMVKGAAESAVQAYIQANPISKESVPMNNIPGMNAVQSGLHQDAQTQKERLAKEPHVSFYIPLEQGEKRGAKESVTINGYRVDYEKGKQHLMPQSHVDILMPYLNIQSSGPATNMNIDRDKETLDALS